VRPGAASDLSVSTAIAGLGIVHLWEDMLRPHLDSGVLEPVLETWWQCFSGPFLYYPGRRHVPTPLRAFIEFIKRGSPLLAASPAGGNAEHLSQLKESRR